MDYLQKIIGAFEVHDAQYIRLCFKQGVDPNSQYNGKPLIYELVNMYLRSPGFKDCVRVFVDYGVNFDDSVLLSVLMDDGPKLDQLLTKDPELIHKKYTLVCTFTPLLDATLLHICAEYNHLDCAKILVKHGSDINAVAGTDTHGFGGQTPIFHTVNQHDNACLDMMKYLVTQNADLEFTVKALIWGKGYDWETLIPAVNPISYAMMGLLRQFQRRESQIYEVIQYLLKARYNIDYLPENVPNKYLVG